MDKAKELSKNPFKIKNKYNKELDIINKIIDKNAKLPESESAEKLIKDIEKLVIKTKDPIQSHIRGNVLSDLGYTELAQMFFDNAKKLGYEVENMTNENYEEPVDSANPGDVKLRYFVFSGAYNPDEDPDFEDNVEDFLNTYPEDMREEVRTVLMDLRSNPIAEAVGTIDIEEDIAADLLDKITNQRLENGTYTVKDLEKEILGNGGTLEMVDKVMANLVNMGFDFDVEVDENYDDTRLTDKEGITYPSLRSVTIHYENGDVVNTNMAAHLTDEEIYDYYKVGKVFNLGNGEHDNLQKVASVTINEDHKQTLPLVADINPNYNIFGDNMPITEKPKFNIDAVKRLIEEDPFLKFSYSNLLTGDFEKDMELIYNTYIKNDDTYSSKLKAYESYVTMLKENVIMTSKYTEDIESILNAFSVDLDIEKVNFIYDISDYVSLNTSKYKSYLNLLTPDLKAEYKTSIGSLSPSEIAMKIYHSGIILSNDISVNNEKLSDALGISTQLAMVLLNIFNAVGAQLQYRKFSDNTYTNSVIFIIIVTLIMKYNA